MAPPPSRSLTAPPARSRDVSAALAVVAALAGWDVFTVVSSAPAWVPSPLGLAGFAAIAWGLGAVLATALVLGGGAIDRALARQPAISGALDGAGLWLLVVVGHRPAGVGPMLGALLFAGAIGAGAFAGGVLRPRFPRALAGTLFVASGTGLALLLPNGQTFLRLALTIVLVATAGPILRWRASPRLVGAGVVLAAALVAFAGPILASSPTARAALYVRSANARAWAFGPLWLLDKDGDRAVDGFGGRDCDSKDGRVFPGASERPGDGRDGNCGGGDGRRRPTPTVASAAGAARGSDVLLVSIDSMRWDVAPALSSVREALGPHAELTRAVSPSPKTVTSLSSTMRGRAAREVRFDEVAGVRGESPAHDRHETLAAPLARAGYRVVFVPTHAYVDPRARVAAGFETVPPRGWPGARPFVDATEALRALGSAIAASDRPICAWVHLMESHHPYRYGGRTGPDSIAGLRASVAWLDRAVSRLVRDVTRLRGRRPIVAVFGDHGEEFGEHGGRLHASTAFAEQVRVTFFLSGPGVPTGRFDGPASTASLPRTILELVGVPAPASMTEPSLVAPLAREAPWPAVAVSEVRSVRTLVGYTGPRFRLVSDPVHDVDLLFDSDVDPSEAEDVSRERPRDLAAMRRLARDWDERH